MTGGDEDIVGAVGQHVGAQLGTTDSRPVTDDLDDIVGTQMDGPVEQCHPALDMGQQGIETLDSTDGHLRRDVLRVERSGPSVVEDPVVEGA
jgi:hypothetical protein